MTDAQQAAYWRHHARRHEATVKARGDYDELKRDAEQFRALAAESMTDHEKALTEAEKRGHAAALAAVGGQLVEAKLEALAAGRLNDTQRATLLENLDRGRFLKDDGTVDVDKLGALVEGIAPPVMGQPATGATANPAPHAPNLGQGARGGRATPSVADGEALYRQHFPVPAAAPQL